MKPKQKNSNLPSAEYTAVKKRW